VNSLVEDKIFTAEDDIVQMKGQKARGQEAADARERERGSAEKEKGLPHPAPRRRFLFKDIVMLFSRHGRRAKIFRKIYGA
jgi:hypothetical protein